MSLDPPRVRGLPLIGSALEFLRGPVAMVQRLHASKGPVFALSLGPKTMVCFIGPQYAVEFFRQPGEVLSKNLASKSVKPIMGDIAFPDDEAGHRRLLDALTPLVSKASFERYTAVMLEEAERVVAELRTKPQFELVGLTERLSQSLALRCFFGDEFAQRADERFREAFADLIKSFDVFLPPNLPLRKFRRRDRARAYIDRVVGDTVRERRSMVDPPNDASQWLSTLRHPDGEYWSMRDTVDLVVSVLFAGHHTTGALMAWTVIHVLQHPQVLARIRQEIDGPEPLTSERLPELTYLAAAIQESARIEPPTGALTRVARHELTLGGYRIRKGWVVALWPRLAQRLPEVFEDPDRYDPERFLRSDALPRHAIIAFGGGTHACIGRPFAQLATRVFVATLLRAFDLALVGSPVVDPKEMLRRPKTPCLVEHRARP
jgi:sterol 14alpha-demethylase